MIVLVLAAAASVAIIPAPPPVAATCAAPQSFQAAQHAPTRTQKLGDLPDAEMDLAVVRRVDGCWVRQVVRFNVSTPGLAAAPRGEHIPGYTGTLVPEARVMPTPTAR